jgi:aspartate aminotransferase-like enzyme
MSISKKAWTVMEKRKTPAMDFAYDLYRWKRMWIPPERGGELVFGFRRQPITMPVHLVFALQEGVKMILEEGVGNRFRRHHIAAEAMRQAAQTLGLELFPETEVASDTVTAINVPEGVDCRKVMDIMKERYGVIISGGPRSFQQRSGVSLTWG